MAPLDICGGIEKHFKNIDDLSGSVPGWALEMARLAMGPVTADLRVTTTAQMQLTRVKLDGAALATGRVSEGALTIWLILSASGEVRSRGCLLDITTMAPGWMRGQDIHFVSSGAVDLIGVTVTGELFDRSVRDIAGIETQLLGSDWWLRTPPGSANCTERGQAIVALQSVLARGAVFSGETCDRLQECVLQILLGEFGADLAGALPNTAPTRRRVARAAEEVLRSRLDDPPSLTNLCELIGASERTLHHAFQESFGMTPKNYLRALQLNAAHRRLRRGQATVTEVAADLGLFHFGRFSTEYRAMFGETPSATLLGARGLKATC